MSVFRVESRKQERGKDIDLSERRLADVYLFDIKKKKLKLVEKGIQGVISPVAWNDAGNKMLYVVRN